MNIQQFQYLLAVAELKHFETAAERCFVTQSTLSTMISRFEDEIGIKVFNRKTKPVSVTSEGKKVLERVQIISKEIRLLENLVQELKGEIVGELRLGIIPTVAPYLLPLFLSDFAKSFPKVRMVVQELTTAEIRKQLKSRLLDIGILAIPIDDDELDEFILFDEPFKVFDCSEGEKKERISINDLDYSKVWFLEEGHCLRTQVQQICDKSNKKGGGELNFEFKAGSMESLIRFTRANKGITILPYMATIDLSEKDKEHLVEIDGPTPVRTIGLLTHQHFVKKNLLSQLKQVILSELLVKLPKAVSSWQLSPV